MLFKLEYRVNKKILLSCLALFLTACASQPPIVATKSVVKYVPPKPVPKVVDTWSESNLKAFHNDWRGTPYRLGGMSRRGVDCSGFVYLAYLNIVGDKLPRTVNEQGELGEIVPRRQLEIGDLVFFKTNRTVRHVGIYVGNDNFLHASTKKGVKISSMNNVYWKPRYWFAKRLDTTTEQNMSLASIVDYAKQHQDY